MNNQEGYIIWGQGEFDSRLFNEFDKDVPEDFSGEINRIESIEPH